METTSAPTLRVTNEILPLGVIFHWGVYSVPGYDDISSAQRRRTQNGSEWYLKRLEERGTYRPVSGWQETQNYHNTYYQGLSYDVFAQGFTYTNFNPDRWMELCKGCGASYVILTVKHHDGFCLWPTTTTTFRARDDLVAMFVNSARKYNLKVGLYYSWMEFRSKSTKDYINRVVATHINELARYNPDIWWFDGDWALTTKYATSVMGQVCAWLRQGNPNVLINDRIGNKKEREDKNYLGSASYRVYEDRCLPTTRPNVPWEHINTIGLSWGRNYQQQERHYKTGEQLYKLYTQVSGLGGRFLINLGPNPDGTLDPYEEKALRDLGKLVTGS